MEFFAKHLLRETRQKISRFIPLIGSRAPNVALPLLFIPALISLVRIGLGFLAIFGCLLFMTGRWALSHQIVPTVTIHSYSVLVTPNDKKGNACCFVQRIYSINVRPFV